MSAPTPIVNGTSGAYLQPAEFGIDSTGFFWVARFEGTRAQMKALIPGIALSGGLYNYRESFTGGKDQLEVRYANQPGNIEQPQTVWEIRYNPVEKDILRSVAARDLTSDEKAQLKEYMADPSFGNAPAVDSGSVMEQFLEIIKSGETSVLEFAPTLTRTITIGSQSQVQASQERVGKIIRTASMFGLEGFPNDLVFTLPNDADPVPDSDDVRILRYGWMKEGPSVTRIAFQKTSIQQNWIYGLWPQSVYGIPF